MGSVIQLDLVSNYYVPKVVLDTGNIVVCQSARYRKTKTERREKSSASEMWEVSKMTARFLSSLTDDAVSLEKKEFS